MVILDPTLRLTRRGITLAERATQCACLLLTSGTLEDALRNSQFDNLVRYQTGWMGGRHTSSAWYLPIAASELRHEASPIPMSQHPSPLAGVLGDIWTGLKAGRVLAARRSTTFELFVQCGIPYVMEGVTAYASALGRLNNELDPEVVHALSRRTRYLAIVRFDKATRTTRLFVSDQGMGCY